MTNLWQHIISIAHAADFNVQGIKFANPDKGGTYEGLLGIVNTVIGVVLDVAGIIAIIFTIYSGILYLTTAGNPDNVKKALNGLIYGGIGIAVIVLSRFIVQTVMNYALTIAK